jgi:hypothetical protein
MLFARGSKWFSNRVWLGALALSCILGFSAPRLAAQSEDSAKGLQGTWRVQINLINCSTGTDIGPSFSSLLAFAEGGTLTGTTRNPAFQPGQRTSDFGTWSKTGRRTYSADSEAFLLFTSTNPPIFQSGTQRITQRITLDGDTFDSVAITRFYGTDGTLLLSGCAHAVATRYK